jgi:hypothetical protein
MTARTATQELARAAVTAFANMGPREDRAATMAVSDMNAWVAAGAMDN